MSCLAGTFLIAAGGLVAAAPASAGSPRLGSRALRAGMSGPDVASLQRELDGAGFKLGASGEFGTTTEDQVRNFERFYSLPVTGVADARFLRTLTKVLALDRHAIGYGDSGGAGLGGSASVKVKTTRKAHTSDPSSVLESDPVMAPVQRNGGSVHLGNRTLRLGMSGHDVRVMQSYLTLDGYPTTVDGDFGPTTKTNVVKWEAANTLTANGVLTYSQSRALRKDVASVLSGGGPTTTKTPTPTPTPVSTAPPAQATINPDGTVTAPAGAPASVQEMITAANSIDDTPYVYGGGHGSFTAGGYDCSGAVSFVLHAAGLLSEPEDSGQLESYGTAGPGTWATIYANSGHAWIVVAGLAFDTAHYGPTTPSGSGPRWLQPSDVTANLNDGTGGYIVRHPAGL